VKDQIPVSRDDGVKVQLLAASPGNALDPRTGTLAWRFALPPGASTTLRFDYELRRAKGKRLEQQQEVQP
jgi:hypothetical protein